MLCLKMSTFFFLSEHQHQQICRIFILMRMEQEGAAMTLTRMDLRMELLRYIKTKNEGNNYVSDVK